MKRIKILIIISIFSLLFVEYFHTIYAITQDLGRHLISGQIILQNHSVYKANLFSYTYPNFPFINHHWLSEVIFYLLFKASGFNGLLLLTVLLAASSFALIFFKSLKNNFFALGLVSGLSLGILFERTDVRPEIFSFLFLSIFLAILYKFREKFTRLIFLLPFIELLWVNMHIYFPIGIILLVFFIIDSIFKNRSFNSRYTGIYLIVLVGCVLATLLNPNGISGAFYPLSVFQNYGYPIEENQNIFFLWSLFHNQNIVFFVASLSLLFISLILNISKSKPIDWFISIFFSILAILSIRNFPLFVFATFIPFVTNFSKSFEELFKFKKIMVVLIFLLIAWQLIRVTSEKTFGFGIDQGGQNAADFFIKNNLKGPIFNNFDIGSYLDYRLYPKEKVFVDGRPEAYPARFFQNIYIPMQQDINLFKKEDEKYKFNTIFFSHRDQTPWAQSFLKRIINDEQWKLVYLDDFIVIFVKDNELNKDINQKLSMDKNNIHLSQFNPSSIDYLLGILGFFTKTDLLSEQINVYRQIINIKPNFCPALQNLYILYSKQKNPAASIYLLKFHQSCR